MKTVFRVLSDFETPYLNCPYCPAQSRPTRVRSHSEIISKLETHLIVYSCVSKHQFFVEGKEKE